MEAVVHLLINGFKQQHEEHYRSLETAVVALLKASAASGGGVPTSSMQAQLDSLQAQLDKLKRERKEQDDYAEELEAELHAKDALVRQLREETKVVEEFRPRAAASLTGPVKDSDELLPSHPLQGLQVSTERVDSKKVTDYFKRNDTIVAEKVKVVQVQEPVNEVVDVEEETEEVEEETEEVEVEEETEEVEVEEETEEVEVEEEAEEAEEAEEVALEEFEYRGATYYRDGENKVFMPNEDGEVDTDAPIGLWNEAKQKILKLPAA